MTPYVKPCTGSVAQTPAQPNDVEHASSAAVMWLNNGQENYLSYLGDVRKLGGLILPTTSYLMRFVCNNFVHIYECQSL